MSIISIPNIYIYPLTFFSTYTYQSTQLSYLSTHISTYQPIYLRFVGERRDREHHEGPQREHKHTHQWLAGCEMAGRWVMLTWSCCIIHPNIINIRDGSIDGYTEKRYRWHCMDNELEQGTALCNLQQLMCFVSSSLPILYIVVLDMPRLQ